MNNFRLSQKKIYKDDRSSIENLHNQRMDNILQKYTPAYAHSPFCEWMSLQPRMNYTIKKWRKSLIILNFLKIIQ